MSKEEEKYREHYGIEVGTIPSNFSGNKSTGVHRIIPDGPLCIENLVALTRKEEQQYLHRPVYFWTSFSVVRSDLKALGKHYNDPWIWEQMKKHALHTEHKKIKSCQDLF